MPNGRKELAGFDVRGVLRLESAFTVIAYHIRADLDGPPDACFAGSALARAALLGLPPHTVKGVESRLAEVKVQEGESIESALRRFKRKVQQEDIIKDIKKHSFYLKPGDKKRAKQALARKRTRKKQRRESE